MRRTSPILRTLRVTAALTIPMALAGCGVFDTLNEIDNAIFRPFQPCCDRYGDAVDWVGQQSMYARTCPCEWDEKRAYWNRPKFVRLPDHYTVISQIGNEEPDDDHAAKRAKTETAPPPAEDDAQDDATDGPQLMNGDEKRGG